MTTIKTSWTKEQVEELVEREKLAYQEIDLPYGITTGGKDRSETSNKIFAHSIEGKSVLDIGCFLGYFCYEAVRRGASRVVGADVDSERLRKAKLIADCLGMTNNIEFRLLDIDTAEPAEKFDIILLLNVLHHLRDPIAVLDKVIAHTKDRLIMEVAGLLSPKPKTLLKSMGAGWWMRRKLEKLPLILVKNSGTTKAGGQKFFFTPLALSQLLMEYRGCFARLDIIRSNFKDRYIAIAWKRQVDNLVIIGGPTSSGKTTFIDSLKDGRLAEIAAHTGINITNNWTYTDAAHIKTISEQKIQNAIYHYDILRVFGADIHNYSNEPGIDILNCASAHKVITIWCAPEVLQQRQQTKIKAKAENWRQRRIRDVLELYQDKKRLASLYQKWLAYCRQKGSQLFFVDCTDRPRLMTHSEWEQKISSLLS